MIKDASPPRLALAHFLEELAPVIDVLKSRDPMLKGYLTSTSVTCGTPGCRCTTGEKHPAWVLRIPHGSTTRNRSIPEAAFRQLVPLTEEYRRFRKAATRFRRLMRAAAQAIAEIEVARQVDPDEQIQRIRDGK